MKNNIHIILALWMVLCCAAVAQAQTVLLKADTVSIPCTQTDTFSVPVRVSNFTNMLGLQFTLRWNPAHLDFQAINMTGSPFTAAGPAVDTSNATTALGLTTFAWGQITPMSVPNNQVVYRVVFKRLAGPSTPITFDGSQTPLIYVTSALDELTPNTRSGLVRVLDGTPPAITCPASVLTGNGPSVINGLAPTVTDNCGIDSIGWSAVGATVANFPNDPDASGAVFNPGLTTVTYRAKDVGGNTVTCSFTINLENNGPDTLTVVAGSAAPNCGSPFFIDVSVLNFDSIGGLQFSVTWDKTLMQYGSISNFNANLNITAGNFSELYTLSDGQLSFNWTSDNFIAGNTLPNGAVLFRINFTNLGSATAASTVGFGNVPTPQEAIAPNATNIPVNFMTGTVNVLDVILPTITCPQNVTLPALPNGTAVVTGLTPTITDNCAGPYPLTFTRSQPTGGTGSGVADGTFLAGTTTVTYAASDAEGNSATCSFTVTVNAGELAGVKLDSVTHVCGQATVTVPVRVYNFDDLVGLNFQVKWNNTVLQYQSVSGFAAGTGIGLNSFPGIATLAPTGALFFAETTTNPNGWPNLADGSVLFNITFNVLNQNGTTNITFEEPSDAINGVPEIVAANFINGNFVSEDQTPPVITCPSNLIVPATQNCQAIVTLPSATATDACSGVSSISNNAPAGNIFPAGSTIVRFTALDFSGNNSTCTMTVTVNANTNLTVSNCPNTTINIAASANACSAPISYPAIVAQNPCNPNATFSYNYNFPVGTVRPVGLTTVVATATQIGGGGGFVTCNINIQITDQTPPVLTCPPGVTLAADPGVCYTKNNPAIPIPVVTDNCTNGIIPMTSQALLDSLPAGPSTLVFIASDQAGNVGACSYVVTVVDAAAPQITCPPNVVVPAQANGCGAVATWATPTATDNCTDTDDIIITSLVASGSFFSVGTSTVTYTATDIGGNQATCSLTVSVTETLPPTVTGCPSTILVILPLNDCDSTITWTPPVFADNCGLDSVAINFMPGTVFTSGTTTINYTAFDFAGNTATCNFNVILRDQVKPQFVTFPNDTIVENATGCGAILNLTPPTVSDNCDPNPAISYAGMLNDTFPVGVTRIEIRVQDASGNLTIDTLVITVISNTVPSFTNIPANITVSGCSGVANWTPPVAQGFCVPPLVTSNFASGSTFPAGTTIVTYTATDTTQANFSVSTTFTVTVAETIPPTITCPQAVVVNAAGAVLEDPSNIVNTIQTNNCTAVTLNLDNASAADNCTTPPTVTQISGPAINGGNFPIGLHTLVFRANDTSNNSATCSVDVMVLSFEALRPNATPTVGCPGGTLLIEAENIPGAVYTWSGPQGAIAAQGSSISFNPFGQAQVGEYIVSAQLNNCQSGNDTVETFLAIQPDAMDDNGFTIELDGAIDSINVLINDVFAPSFDIVVSLEEQLPGLTLSDDNLFSFDAAGLSSGQFQFIYKICSETCPNLCDMATATITIRDVECNFVPNIFTPNADNVNDWLEIPCLYSGLYPNNEIVIYNQWGDKVFEAKNYANDPMTAWQGTLNNEPGKDLPDGVYYYIFRPAPNDPVIKGFVHIFR
jgi:large repetitive protein